MPLERLHFTNREDWLAGRTTGIGASSAAAAVGISKWQTNQELWEIMAGHKKSKRVNNRFIEFGNKMEPVMREMFKVKHTEYKLYYNQFDILYLSERPWLRATLDGELYTDSPTHYGANHGILEIKTATLTTRAQWDEWKDGYPQGYFCQTVHQLLATGWDFVILFALLMGQNEWVVREYRIDRTDQNVADGMEWLLKEETKFWGYVEADKRPPLILPEI